MSESIINLTKVIEMFYEFPARCSVIFARPRKTWQIYNPYIPALLKGDRENWGWMRRELPAWQSHRVNARQGMQNPSWWDQTHPQEPGIQEPMSWDTGDSLESLEP